MGFNIKFIKGLYSKYVKELSLIFNDKIIIDCILSKVCMFNAYIQLIHSDRNYYHTIPQRYRSDPLMIEATINSNSPIDSKFYRFYISYLRRYNPTLSKNIITQLIQYGDMLSVMPIDMYTPEICLNSLKDSSAATNVALIIKHKPEYLTTEYLLAIISVCSRYQVTQCWQLLLNYIQDDSIHIAAFEKGNMAALPHITTQTEQMWMKYCISNGKIVGIPQRFLTKQFYINILIAKTGDYYGGWMYIPAHLLTKQFAMDCVTQDWKTIKTMKGKFKLKKLCVEALRQSPLAIDYIPKRYKSKSVCQDCFERNHATFGSIPDEHKSEEMCMVAVKQDPRMLTCVPKRCLSEDIVFVGIQKSSTALNNVLESLRSLNMYLFHYNKWISGSANKSILLRDFVKIKNVDLRNKLFIKLMGKEPVEIGKHLTVDMEDVYWGYLSSLELNG